MIMYIFIMDKYRLVFTPPLTLPKEIYKPGVETVLVNGPPIGQQTFSSNLICQRMPPVPASS